MGTGYPGIAERLLRFYLGRFAKLCSHPHTSKIPTIFLAMIATVMAAEQALGSPQGWGTGYPGIIGVATVMATEQALGSPQGGAPATLGSPSASSVSCSVAQPV